jgi:hypothetical protein
MGWTVGSCVSAPGRIFYVAPPYDSEIEQDIRQHFREAYIVSFDNYPILTDHLPLGEMIPFGLRDIQRKLRLKNAINRKQSYMIEAEGVYIHIRNRKELIN